jgi:iron complex outermembrane recepter protein
MTITQFGLSNKLRCRLCQARYSAWIYALIALVLQLNCFSATAGDALDKVITIDIPTNTSLDDALIEWGIKVDVEVMASTATVEHRITQGVHGTLRASKALSILLRDTGLTYSVEGQRVRVVPAATLVPSGERTEPDSPMAVSSSEMPIKLASEDAGTTDKTQSDVLKKDLDMIVVTAQKREERLQDVPVPVTAINAERLEENNLTRLQEYYSSIPGFVVSQAGGEGNVQTLTIRGIVSGDFTTPTVGVTVDDVPYGSSIKIVGNVVPDFDPSDLARIEVLRGPQGTLYGAGSLGGLLKYVTLDPSTSGFTGHMETDISSVYNGSEPGHGVRAAINIPLSETLAVRASAFSRQDAGYIDNPTLGIDGINKSHTNGGRLSALLQVSEAVSLKVSAVYQDSRGDGVNDVNPALGDLQQDYIRGVGPWDKRLQAYSAVWKAKLGDVDLTSVTGYNVNTWGTSLDLSGSFSAIAQKVLGQPGAPLFSWGKTDKVTQEVRASIPLGQRFEWLVGGFFTHESSLFAENLSSENPLTGALVGTLVADHSPTVYREYAAFTDLTVHFTDKFDVQFGGRESRIEQDFGTTPETGALYGAGVLVPGGDTTANAFTYLVTPRFVLSPDMMVYARLASGYRPGGSNSSNVDPGVPRAYSPDKTQNYEVGAKGDVLQHILSFDASLYYIDWNDIQLTEIDSEHLGYGTNGSRAKSEGAELSVTARPLRGLAVTAWSAYGDAELTEAMPSNSAVYGVPGNRLPSSPHFSGNFAIDDEFPISSKVAGFAGASVSYVGDRLGDFTATPQRQFYPAYTKTDLHAGVTYDGWRANFYVNNVADIRGLVGGEIGSPTIFYYIQPRTIGLSLTNNF